MDQNLKGALLPKITAIELKSIGKTLDASMQSISTPQNSQKQSITPKFTISEDNYSNNSYENVYPCYENSIQHISTFLGHIRQFCVCLCINSPNLEIPQGFCGLKLRFGRYIETMGPGLQFISPFTEKVVLVDLQTQTMDLVKQNVITKDNLVIMVDTAINYKILNPRFAFFRIQNLIEGVENLAYAALRAICGGYKLNEILEKKSEITKEIRKYMDQRAQIWGVFIEETFLTDIILNKDLENTLSSAASAQRAAISKIISAKADIESAKIMKAAADTLSSEAAMQIRYLQTISKVGKNACPVVFIPFVQDENF